MDIAHLGQTPAGGVVLCLLRGQGLFQLLPAGFCGSQRVVAVAHGQRQRVAAGGIGVFLVKFFLTAQHGQRVFDLRDEGGILHRPACHMAAAQHQLTLVYLGQAVLVGGNGLDEGAIRVVRQHHDMGRFQRSAGTHLHAGRDAAFHGALAGAHGTFFAPAVAVSFQVHTPYKTLPHPAALLGALHIDKAVHRPGEHVLGVILHGGVDLFHPRIGVSVLQIHLRQDQVQSAGRTRSGLFCPLPVAAVAGKLVTGNAAPLLQRHLLRRQQDVCGCKTGSRFHSRFLPSLLQFNFFNATATTLNCISQICCLNVALIFDLR